MQKINIIEYVKTGMGDGGAETLIKDYALMLDREKFNVTIVTISPVDTTSANYARLKESGIEIIPIFEKTVQFKSWLKQKLWNRLCYKRTVSKRLLEIIKEKQANVVHCHLEVLFSLVLIAKQIRTVKLIWTCHNEPDVIFKKIRWECEEESARYLLKNNNLQIIALHENMKNELNARFSVSNVKIIYNGINFDKFRKINESAQEIRTSVGVPTGAYVVGHVGRFSYAKNHGFLIDIFKRVVEREPNSFLLLIGHGPFLDESLQKLHNLGLDGKYLILSHRSDVYRLLKAMDVFLFPSIYEGLPVSLVEAQVSGLRCIASDNITHDCFFSEECVPLRIEESPEKWADAILNKNIKGPYKNYINLFDMSKEIIRLGKLYEEN